MAATSLYHPSNDPKTPSKPSNNPISASKVRVIVRVRPFLQHEFTSHSKRVSCISLLDQESQSRDEVAVYLKDPYTSRSECYQLDSFFDREDDDVSPIFETEVSPLLPHIFNGCNATVFAYGATGSGKTYTMQGTEEHPGLIPLAMSNIIYICQNTGSTAHLSYYEVYMDRCYDLLELKATEISVLDDHDGQIHLRGLSQVPVHTMSEFLDVFASGVQRRKVAHTALNDVSSRSHGVFVISVVSAPDKTGRSVCGKLNLIDLAGNEDNRRSGSEGIRLQESAKINQSLFALSNVIYALNNNQPRIPYRESKLTRILQDSLGGTSRALMVACLNPGEYQESVNTVSLAARSRHISNFVPSAHKLETPKPKVDMEAKLRSWLESKGKAKTSHQRLGPFLSPILKKTPSSIMNSAKKSVTFCTSVKVERTSINQDAQKTTERTFAESFRNLMDDEASFDSFKEDTDRSEIEHEVNKAVAHRDLPIEPLSKGVNSQITNVSKDALLQSPLLESKGKAKTSHQRIEPFLSPILKKTPSSFKNSAKKSVTFCTSVKVERISINQDAQPTTESGPFADSFRNLIDNEAAFHSFKEDNDRREIEHEVNKAACEIYRDLPVEPLSKGANSQITNVSKDGVLQSPLSKGVNSQITNASKDAVLQSPLRKGVNSQITNASKDAVLQSPLSKGVNSQITNASKDAVLQSPLRKGVNSQITNASKDAVLQSPLSKGVNSQITNASKDAVLQSPLSKGVNSQITNASTDAVLQSPLSKGVNSQITNVSKDAVLQTPLSKGVNSQITNVSKDAVLQTPLREALTPINIDANSTLTQTPFTPFSANCSTNNGTPLDKFSARSSAMKNSLVKEYVDLLNNASREELLELKGIGEKRADYIIELREESPLKSLSDLEKIGLSLKQAKSLFTKSARKLFEYKKEDSTID